MAKPLNDKVLAGVAALVIATATPFIAKWEGVETKAYRDVIGVPTVCYGETRNVKMTDTYTKEQCVQMLKVSVKEYYDALQVYITNPNIPVGVQASMLELSYNAGVSAVGKSTMMRLANQSKYVEACNELGKWVKSGGKTFKGLENRRADSKVSLCLLGLKK